VDLVRPHSSQQQRNGNEKKGRKPMVAVAFSESLNSGRLYFCIIIPHEVMLTLCVCIYLNAVKQEMTSRKIPPVKLFSAGGAEFELTLLLVYHILAS